jgi:uncharacterized membrane protein
MAGRVLTYAYGLVVTLIEVSALTACPVCDTETGQQVRAGIFGGNFASDLFATALPFVILLVLVALLHFGPPRPRKSPGAGGQDPPGQNPRLR